ncbi:acetyl-coenzyme A synthetase [Caballeronia insecticola]|uniref:Acetyl-coenzyme A synthetase n=1 Tax=Caballeronia insecticola TaxID=758793 RepID=R4WFD0_9BURK|nr:acetyl-coenzyme A synthetase [Caballeronia insecticola]BAN22298.1 acetyl-coenzyme A synthetase [Caballeronia insecticola]
MKKTSSTPLRHRTSAQSLSMMMCGSTGKPKGVPLWSAQSMKRTFDMKPGDI